MPGESERGMTVGYTLGKKMGTLAGQSLLLHNHLDCPLSLRGNKIIVGGWCTAHIKPPRLIAQALDGGQLAEAGVGVQEALHGGSPRDTVLRQRRRRRVRPSMPLETGKRRHVERDSHGGTDDQREAAHDGVLAVLVPVADVGGLLRAWVVCEPSRGRHGVRAGRGKCAVWLSVRVQLNMQAK